MMQISHLLPRYKNAKQQERATSLTATRRSGTPSQRRKLPATQESAAALISYTPRTHNLCVSSCLHFSYSSFSDLGSSSEVSMKSSMQQLRLSDCVNEAGSSIVLRDRLFSQLLDAKILNHSEAKSKAADITPGTYQDSIFTSDSDRDTK